MIMIKPFNYNTFNGSEYDVYLDGVSELNPAGYLNLDSTKLMQYLIPVVS